MATPSQWLTVQQWASHLTGDGHDPTAACILELRTNLAALTARIEALEAQAAQPAQAEQEQGPERGQEAEPLVKRMHHAWRTHRTWAAEIDAVADWFDARAVGVDAVVALRIEARRAREGA